MENQSPRGQKPYFMSLWSHLGSVIPKKSAFYARGELYIMRYTVLLLRRMQVQLVFACHKKILVTLAQSSF